MPWRHRHTLVVLTADSGVARGQHGLIGKQNCYEHSVRVPLVVAGPGVAANARTRAMVYTYDLLPTVGAYCKIPAPSTSQGQDWTKVFQDPTAPGRRELTFAYKSEQRAIRTERWKLIHYPAIAKTQLFDLTADAWEANDLMPGGAHAAVAKTLLEKLGVELAAAGDRAPLHVAQPKPAAWQPPRASEEPRPKAK
jgi:arylsulfatase A-like enzyme